MRRVLHSRSFPRMIWTATVCSMPMMTARTPLVIPLQVKSVVQTGMVMGSAIQPILSQQMPQNGAMLMVMVLETTAMRSRTMPVKRWTPTAMVLATTVMCFQTMRVSPWIPMLMVLVTMPMLSLKTRMKRSIQTAMVLAIMQMHFPTMPVKHWIPMAMEWATTATPTRTNTAMTTAMETQ